MAFYFSIKSPCRTVSFRSVYFPGKSKSHFLRHSQFRKAGFVKKLVLAKVEPHTIRSIGNVVNHCANTKLGLHLPTASSLQYSIGWVLNYTFLQVVAISSFS